MRTTPTKSTVVFCVLKQLLPLQCLRHMQKLELLFSLYLKQLLLLQCVRHRLKVRLFSMLKEDKSSGDGWVKNMPSNLVMSLLLVLQLMYNTILKFHIYPTSWRTTVVNEIFKQKGPPEGNKNYRAISLVHLLAK